MERAFRTVHCARTVHSKSPNHPTPSRLSFLSAIQTAPAAPLRCAGLAVMGRQEVSHEGGGIEQMQ